MHIAFVIAAMQAVAADIGLAGTEPPPTAA